MIISRDIISKRIGQGLAIAAILAYWAPVVGAFSSQMGAYLPVTEASVIPSKNITVAYEIMENVNLAATVN